MCQQQGHREWESSQVSQKPQQPSSDRSFEVDQDSRMSHEQATWHKGKRGAQGARDSRNSPVYDIILSFSLLRLGAAAVADSARTYGQNSDYAPWRSPYAYPRTSSCNWYLYLLPYTTLSAIFSTFHGVFTRLSYRYRKCTGCETPAYGSSGCEKGRLRTHSRHNSPSYFPYQPREPQSHRYSIYRPQVG